MMWPTCTHSNRYPHVLTHHVFLCSEHLHFIAWSTCHLTHHIFLHFEHLHCYSMVHLSPDTASFCTLNTCTVTAWSTCNLTHHIFLHLGWGSCRVRQSDRGKRSIQHLQPTAQQSENSHHRESGHHSHHRKSGHHSHHRESGQHSH